MTGADETDRSRSNGHPGPEGVPHRQFETAYAAGDPAWVIGEAQPVVCELLERGWLDRGPLLDAGCGTGENLVEIARRRPGLQITAVDAVPEAVDRARRLIAAQGLESRIALGVTDLRTDLPPGPFGTVLDAGVLHVFSDADRRAYLERVVRSLVPGGWFLTVVFSDRERRPGGPRRLGERELTRVLMEAGLVIEAIEEARYHTTSLEGGAEALLARARTGTVDW